MTSPSARAPHLANAQARLNRLLGYLESDPANQTLLGDAAASALDAQQFALCDELLSRYRSQRELPPALVNLLGLSALAQRKFAEALEAFQSLHEARGEPVVRYNIAYANAMLGHFDEAIAELDDTVLEALPAAATLKLRSLHHLGRLDEALALGKHYTQSAHCDPELHAALATALFDAEDLESARRHAEQAPDTPDGLTVRGLLALDGDSAETARALFERALALNANSGRAMLGVGLALLSEQQFTGAAPALDRAAQLLQTHAGSWISAGWAHLFNGDLAQARARFEEGGRIDRGFAEAPGGLAVVDLKEGKLEDAKRHAEIALRLDRACLSAALAQSLLASAAGDQATADAIREAALSQPLDPRGTTIAQALVRQASKRAGRP